MGDTLCSKELFAVGFHCKKSIEARPSSKLSLHHCENGSCVTSPRLLQVCPWVGYDQSASTIRAIVNKHHFIPETKMLSFWCCWMSAGWYFVQDNCYKIHFTSLLCSGDKNYSGPACTSLRTMPRMPRVARLLYYTNLKHYATVNSPVAAYYILNDFQNGFLLN